MTDSGPVLACHILTIFPGFFESPLGTSIIGRAIERDLLAVQVHDIRDWAEGKHRVTDDTPYGGGAGMVMKPEPIVRALEAVEEREVAAGRRRPYRVALTPCGCRFDQRMVERLADKRSLALVCGRYEGIDERVMEFVDVEVSLGDYVLTGGEPAALAILDAMVRFVPGALGNESSVTDESFGAGLLEYPQYTRPAVFRGHRVPDVLASGDHGRVDRWRRGQALLRTLDRRPDLWSKLEPSEEDRKLLRAARHAKSNVELGAQSLEEDES